MELTPNILLAAPTYSNPLKEITTSFRSQNLNSISDNLIDNNECLDFTNNEIIHLGGFPALYKLNTLLLGNNEVMSIDDDIANQIPNVRLLALQNNDIASFSQLYKLRGLKNLKSIVLLDNPINKNINSRSFLISSIESLEVINFEKIKLSERNNAKELNIEKLLNISESSHTDPKKKKKPTNNNNVNKNLTEEDRQLLKKKLVEAKTLKEVKFIETQLKSGHW